MVASSFTAWISSLLIMMPIFLLALTVHEFSHAAVATILGDSTARRSGRLTLNPLAHIDPYGLLFLIFFRVGWAKPVPFDPRNFRYPRLDAILTAFAGPLSNMITAWALLVWRTYGASHPMLVSFLTLGAWVNVMLGVFNLLPVPPLDGGHLLDVLCRDRFPEFVLFLRRYSFFIIIILFYLPQTRLMFIQAIQTVLHFIEQLVP